jgi:hypothetical protein
MMGKFLTPRLTCDYTTDSSERPTPGDSSRLDNGV